MFTHTLRSLQHLDNFAIYVLLGLGFIGSFTWAYIRFTPYDEIALIRKGNVAAAISLAGATLGFACTICSVIVYAGTWQDMVVWSVIGGAAQFCAYFVTALVLRDMRMHIMEKENIAASILLFTVSLIIGLVIAASMSE